MLTPLDIENKKFQKQMMNGYNVDEVDDFLDEITVDYEKLYKENTELRAEIEKYSEKLAVKKQIIVATKADLAQDDTNYKKLEELAKQYGRKVEDLEKNEDIKDYLEKSSKNELAVKLILDNAKYTTK